MKFRKKPVVIEAVQFTGENDAEVFLFLGFSKTYFSGEPGPSQKIEIRTLEGVLTASRGDWIIKGIRGEFYPCKPDIFEATYERAEE